MKHTLLTMFTVLIFLGCQDNKNTQAKHDAKIAQQAREELLAELKEKEKRAQENDRLSQIGITTVGSKIIIDTNKTKGFFKDLGNKMKNRIEKLSKDIEEGRIKNKDVGIAIDESHISVDLNRTNNFLKKWGEKMEKFVKDIDTIMKEASGTKN